MSKANSLNWTRRTPRKGIDPVTGEYKQHLPGTVEVHRDGRFYVTKGPDSPYFVVREWHGGNRETVHTVVPTQKMAEDYILGRKSFGRKDLCLRPGNHLSLGGEEVFVVSVSPDNRTAQVRFGSGKTQTVSLRENPRQGKSLGWREDPSWENLHSVADVEHGHYSIFKPGGYRQQPSSDFYHLLYTPNARRRLTGVTEELQYHFDPDKLKEYAEGHDEDTYIIPTRQQEEKRLSGITTKSLRFGGGRKVLLPQLRKAVEDKPKLRSSHVEPGTHPREPGYEQEIGAGKGQRTSSRLVHGRPNSHWLREYYLGTADSGSPIYRYRVWNPETEVHTSHGTYDEAFQRYLHNTGEEQEISEGKGLRRRGKAAGEEPQLRSSHVAPGTYPRHMGIQEGGGLEKGARQNFRIVHHRDGIRLAEVHAGTRQVQGMPLQTVRQYVVGGLGMEPTYHQDYESALSHYQSLTGETEEKSLRRRGKAVPDKPELRSSYIAPGTYPHTPGPRQSYVPRPRHRGSRKGKRGSSYRLIHQQGEHIIAENTYGVYGSGGSRGKPRYSYTVANYNDPLESGTHYGNYEEAARHYHQLTGVDLLGEE